MSLFRIALVTTFTLASTTSAPAQPKEPRVVQVATQQEPEPRVEIGEATLTVFDESGHPIKVE